MPEEKPQLNIYEKMTPNEEVYYSFLKNLQFVFAELEKAEEDYAIALLSKHQLRGQWQIPCAGTEETARESVGEIKRHSPGIVKELRR